MQMARSNEQGVSNVELLHAIALGSKDAERLLVEKYYKNLFFILRSQTQDNSLSEDICQETFLKVIEKARSKEIRNPEAIGAFIRQTGINILIEHKRSIARRKTYSSDTIDQHEHLKQSSTLHHIHSAKLVEITQQIIRELPTERDRTILHDFFLQGIEKKVICQQQGVSAAHFDRVLFRARQRLKQALAIKLNVPPGECNLYHILSTLLTYVCLSQWMKIYGSYSERLF
jgi:RNA polymerase sigma-70 factor (ECF subfamily)|tara:strand:- start:1176 stop:1865 length:690 start_codon:yes stop_codon:yes gene_type:complete